ncbi:MAG: HPr family phosphocarrier protein [Casimicrobiaceae bacterium]
MLPAQLTFPFLSRWRGVLRKHPGGQQMQKLGIAITRRCLHARSSAKIVQLASRFRSHVTLAHRVGASARVACCSDVTRGLGRKHDRARSRAS